MPTKLARIFDDRYSAPRRRKTGALAVTARGTFCVPVTLGECSVTINSGDQNQRTMRAIILCVLVAIIYTQLFLAPKKKNVPPETASSSTETVVQTPGAPAAQQALPPPVSPPQVVGTQNSAASHPSSEELAKAPTTYVETSRLKLALSHLGTRAVSFKLNDYKLRLGEELSLDMVDNPSGAPLPLGVIVGNQSDERVNYALTAIDGKPADGGAANLKLAEKAELLLEFKGTLPSGEAITKRIKLRDDSYLFSTEVVLEHPLPEGQTAWLEWSHYYPKDAENSRVKLTHLTYLDGYNKIRHVTPTELTEGVRDFGTSRWVSLGDLHFMSALIPSVEGRNTMLGREGDLYIARIAGTREGGIFTAYVGPKDYQILQATGEYSLERAIDLGWFSFLAYPLLRLLHYLYLILGNYGLAIIALTLLVKAVLLPLSKAGFTSMSKMQELQPEIKALRERIKDPTQLNQEIFALYQRRGVNPMGGCLPMFIQIPVFFGLYQALLNSIELRHARFALWITDLSSPEKLPMFGVGVPVMVLLMAVSMVIQQWTTPNTTTDPMQRRMMMMMPIVFAGMFIVFPMPAGLVLYWLTNNIISITQQVYMRNSNKGSVYVATLIASTGIFVTGYLLTLI